MSKFAVKTLMTTVKQTITSLEADSFSYIKIQGLEINILKMIITHRINYLESINLQHYKIITSIIKNFEEEPTLIENKEMTKLILLFSGYLPVEPLGKVLIEKHYMFIRIIVNKIRKFESKLSDIQGSPFRIIWDSARQISLNYPKEKRKEIIVNLSNEYLMSKNKQTNNISLPAYELSLILIKYKQMKISIELQLEYSSLFPISLNPEVLLRNITILIGEISEFFNRRVSLIGVCYKNELETFPIVEKFLFNNTLLKDRLVWARSMKEREIKENRKYIIDLDSEWKNSKTI